MDNIVIGIEGYVGSGKTSICKELLKKIPNSILIHGGNIYRAIVYSVLNSGIDLDSIKSELADVDIKSIMDKFKIDIQLKNRETEVYIDGRLISNEMLQSNKSSIAVSIASNVANNEKLYDFGKKLIDEFKEKYNIILSSRDIMKMYPETDYHFFITASLEERVNRKYIQYNGTVTKKKLKKDISIRDTLQRESGYYNIYPNTIEIDVTDCKTVEESTKRVLENIKLTETIL